MEVHALNLSKNFGNKVALRSVNFEISSNSLAILGHNGSGKTTLLSIISGLLKPSSGKLILNGLEPYKKREEILKFTSFVFEKPKFELKIKVSDYFKFLYDFYDKECVKEFKKKFIDNIGQSYVYELSSGQTQVLQLIQALCSDSKIKILDEPFSHLDQRNISYVGEYLKAKNFELIFSTHVIEEAEWLASHIIILKDGKVVWYGKFEDLARQDFFEVFFRFPLTRELEPIAKLGTIAIVRSDEDYLSKLVKDGKILGFKRLGLRRFYEDS
ncbi:MAG: ABC transporter ATP-binding protein [Sulfolobaceae archaeon]